jgi:hypothetical protein
MFGRGARRQGGGGYLHINGILLTFEQRLSLFFSSLRLSFFLWWWGGGATAYRKVAGVALAAGIMAARCGSGAMLSLTFVMEARGGGGM